MSRLRCYCHLTPKDPVSMNKLRALFELDASSTDVFVVMPDHAKSGKVIFGKNSSRPGTEVQEVVYVKSSVRPKQLKCTYITIDESTEPLNSVILSKPAWMWGAEMGANDKNVCIGNTSVWAIAVGIDADPKIKRLLGTDLVRLGLERGNSAEHALHTIIGLIERYGQGGPAVENDYEHCHHNSFLIADFKEAWVLETVGKIWVAQRITSGVRNISNKHSITTVFDLHCDNLYEFLEQHHFLLEDGQFNFLSTFGSIGDLGREYYGYGIVHSKCQITRDFDAAKMMSCLREKYTGICRDSDHKYPTAGSQVSTISDTVSTHYFTGTQDTTLSIFKPFVFTPNVQISEYTVSSLDDAARQHALYKVHQKVMIKEKNMTKIWKQPVFEEEQIKKVENGIRAIEAGISDISIFDTLMKDSVESELIHYLFENGIPKP